MWLFPIYIYFHLARYKKARVRTIWIESYGFIMLNKYPFVAIIFSWPNPACLSPIYILQTPMIPEGKCMKSLNRVVWFHYVKSNSICRKHFSWLIANLYVLPPHMIPKGTCTNSSKIVVWFHYVKPISICRKHFFMAKASVLIANP